MNKLIIKSMNVANLNYTMKMPSVKFLIPESYSRYWTVTITKNDGSTVVNPRYNSVTTNVESIRIDGQSYIWYDPTATWYKVVSTDGTIYIDGYSRQVDSWETTLSEDVNVSYEEKEFCFSEHMTVKCADGLDRPISQIFTGDMVKAYNPDTEQIVDAQVLESSSKLYQKTRGYDKYTFSDGSVLEIVFRDRVYNVEENKMKWMDQWEIGEHGLNYDGQEIELMSHEFIDDEIGFYTFNCEYKNYFINGVLAGKPNSRYPFFHSRFVEESKN